MCTRSRLARVTEHAHTHTRARARSRHSRDSGGGLRAVFCASSAHAAQTLATPYGFSRPLHGGRPRRPRRVPRRARFSAALLGFAPRTRADASPGAAEPTAIARRTVTRSHLHASRPSHQEPARRRRRRRTPRQARPTFSRDDGEYPRQFFVCFFIIYQTVVHNLGYDASIRVRVSATLTAPSRVRAVFRGTFGVRRGRTRFG